MLELSDFRKDFRRLRPEMMRQKAMASRSCQALLKEPKDLRVQRVQGSYTRYGTRPVVEELLRRSLEMASIDPKESCHLAVLAQEAVKKIFGREALAGGERSIPDLNALVQAHLGNASRLLRRFDAAEEHFQNALVFLVQGSGDLCVFGGVYSLYASYLKCRRQLKGALTFLDKAEEAYCILRDDKRRGKILLQRAGVLEDLRELTDAVVVVRAAIPLLAGEGSQALRALAHHNQAFYLCELGRGQEALEAFEEGESLFRWLPVPVHGTVNHRLWTHGKVRWGVGEFARAESLLQEALDGFERRQQDPFRCALVSLDLAGVYAQQDRLEELVPLVESTYESLKSHGLDPEAEKALQLLVTSAQRRQLTMAVLRAAAEQLRGSLYCRGSITC